MTDALLDHLAVLVACDTQNPPRSIAADDPVFAHVRSALPGDFEIEVTDHGLGRVSLLAIRGEPRLLFNVHLDTVPAGEGWRHDPLVMTREDARVYGRGTCDIKGAAAALLTIAQSSSAPMALLFSTDEEGASGCCIREYCKGLDPARWSMVIVAEPTGCRPASRHRGYLSVIGRFRGVAGHSSEPRALEDNAIHAAARWAAGALELVSGDSGDERSCFNIGRIEGGIKSNVIADHLEVRWSARLPGGASNDRFFDRIVALPGGERATWARPFSGPPLPAGRRDTRAAEAFLAAAGLGPGVGVDFWTEASLFSEAGAPAIVLGPGHIEQAHIVDEWVELSQLATAEMIYRRLVESDGRDA